MTDKNKVRSTVWLDKKLKVEFEKKHGTRKLSSFVNEMIEFELYQEKPDYIKRKIAEKNGSHEHEIKMLKAQLKIAEEKQKKKKEKLQATAPKINLYRPGGD